MAPTIKDRLKKNKKNRPNSNSSSSIILRGPFFNNTNIKVLFHFSHLLEIFFYFSIKNEKHEKYKLVKFTREKRVSVRTNVA